MQRGNVQRGNMQRNPWLFNVKGGDLSPSRQCGPKQCVHGTCNEVLPHCRHHWGVQWWRGLVEQWLPEVVVVGNGGDAVGVVMTMVVVEKGKACLLY